MNAAAARLALALAYPWLAHAAGTRDDPLLAAFALADVVLVILLEPLARRRAWAWLALPVAAAALWWLARSPHALLPLLVVPIAFVGWVAWAFARTLRAGQVPLVGRIVSALERTPFASLAPGLQAYTRKVTAAWAVVLALLGGANLVLALVAQPRGLLASLGLAAPFSVSQAQWSLWANVLDYGVLGGFFLLEYVLRQRWHPDPFPGLLGFLRALAALGPAFWRGLLR